MCFGCSKELSHSDGSFEYPQHMFWMRNKENIFPIRTLIWRPDTGLFLWKIKVIYSFYERTKAYAFTLFETELYVIIGFARRHV